MSIDVLTAHRIRLPSTVIEVAAAAGLDLAAACTLLDKESGGGQNLWGHDPVQTGGIYTKGGQVTAAQYAAYKARRGELGCQGVGPAQLTFWTLQDDADRIGGCHVPAANMRVGFAHLAGLIARYGERDGFRRYNGQGSAAEAYAADAMVRLAEWRDRLGDTTTTAGVPATLREGDTGARVARLQRWLNAMYPAYSRIDLAPQRYGPQTVRAVAEFQRRSGVTGPDADGRTCGPRTFAALLAAGYRP